MEMYRWFSKDMLKSGFASADSTAAVVEVCY